MPPIVPQRFPSRRLPAGRTCSAWAYGRFIVGAAKSFFTSLLLTLGLYAAFSACAAAAERASKASDFWGYVTLGDVLVLGGFWWALGYFGPAQMLEVYSALMLALTLLAMRALERLLGWLPPLRRFSPPAQLVAGVGLPWLVASGALLWQGVPYTTIVTEGMVRPLFLLGVLYLLNRLLWKRS